MRIAQKSIPETHLLMMNSHSDEVSQKSLGRDGRNMRAFEKAVGVSFNVETHHTAFISCFDPLRRFMPACFR